MSISSVNQDRLARDYDSKKEQYKDFAKSLAGLIENLLSHQKIQTVSVSFRAKDISSLAGKLRRPDKSYDNLTDITDLAGVRVTAYFADDVDLIAKMLSAEFSVDESSSIDKRRYENPNQFGYLSLHYVLSFNSNRSDLAEYRKFAGLKCEVQVRSILQHAWAEIEHDLGYKSTNGVPALLRRKFARIASLLELADDEFCSIRRDLSAYETGLPDLIRLKPETVELNLPSFNALYVNKSALRNLDYVVVDAGKGVLEEDYYGRRDMFIESFKYFGINTVEELEKAAEKEVGRVADFVVYWLEGESLDVVNAGIGAFYLLYILAWHTKDRVRVLEYFRLAGIGVDEEMKEKITMLLNFTPRGG